jgi:urease accessory protein
MSAFARNRLLAVGVATLAFPALLHAHTQGAPIFDCASGLAHPFHGWDHLLALVAVGLWAAQLGGAARWRVPAAFAAAMACGAALGVAGSRPDGLETIAVTTVLILGLLTTAAERPRVSLGLAFVALLGLAHGLVHGAEMPPGVDAAGYGSGLMLATVALHALGFALGHAARRTSASLPRALGAACAAAGCVLLLT